MLQDFILKGSADKSVRLRIIDSTDGTPETGVVFNTSGIDLWYRRELSARVAITEATLAALTTAHADGGFLHISDGYYRLDLPDAAFATGANYVEFGGVVTGMVVIGGVVKLTDSNIFHDTVRGGFTALPNAAADAAGGVPISDAGGLDLDAKLANTNEVTAARMAALTDWINGGRLDLILDIIAADTTTDIPALIAALQAVADAILVDTGTTLQAELDAIQAAVITNAAGVDIAADIIALKAETAAILADTTVIGATGQGLTSLATQASVDTIDDFLDTEIAAILVDTSTTIDDLVDDLEGRLTAALATALQAHGLGIGRGVVDALATTSTIPFKSVNDAAASATDDFYNGRHIIFTSGTLTLQATSITDYTGLTKTATVPAVTSIPAEDVSFIIV